MARCSGFRLRTKGCDVIRCLRSFISSLSWSLAPLVAARPVFVASGGTGDPFGPAIVLVSIFHDNNFIRLASFAALRLANSSPFLNEGSDANPGANLPARQRHEALQQLRSGKVRGAAVLVTGR